MQIQSVRPTNVDTLKIDEYCLHVKQLRTSDVVAGV